jgi:hypothetical protein
MLAFDSTGNGQSELQCCRPALVDLGQSSHLVRCQSKISKNHPERLTSVDRIEELPPELDGKPLLRSGSPK